MTTVACRLDAMVQATGPDRAVWVETLADPRSRPTPAHSPEWFGIVRDAYGHEPLYLAAEGLDGDRAVLPAFIVRRPLAGAVITSMPYLDSGGPCGSSASLSALLVETLVDHGRRIGARAIELRSSEPLPIGVPARTHKVNMTLELPQDADLLWRRVNKSVRNQVRKAERSGLAIEVAGADALPMFYDVFAARMRDLGSPVHARRFLAAVMESFGSRARVVLARLGGTTVGGLIAIRFQDRLTVPWAACLERYFPLCPNMLLYWETLRSACGEGVRRFDFGRSTRDSGTYRFKQQWGAREEPLFWYTMPLRPQAATPPRGGGRTGELAVTAWQRLPLPLTRWLGPHIRKYLTQ